MLNWRLSKTAYKAAATAASLAAMLVLAACEERPYPSPASAPPPPPPSQDLAGGPPPPPVPPTPPLAPQSTAPVVIAMAPIPNPPERRRASRVRRPAARYAVARPAAPRAAPAPAPAPKVAAAPAKPAAKVAVTPPPAKTVVPKGAAPKVASTAPPKVAAAPIPPAADADRPSRLAALETALKDALGKVAVLNTPATFNANQPTDVSMTIPAAFADTVKDEAGKQKLADAASSVNMTAILSGDGFAVTPDETQSQPLTAGQPTEFHWTVTAMQGAKGPLHADVGADLLGAGSDALSLGTVQKKQGFNMQLTPRVLGAALLALIAVLVVAWLARGRGSAPSRSRSARRASSRARSDRPLDLGDQPQRA